MSDQTLTRLTLAVKATEKRTTATGKTYLLVTTADEQKYSVWDQNLWDHIGQGVSITVDADLSGNYKVIKSLVTGAPPTATVAPGTIGARDVLIAREVALKAAVDCIGPLPLGVEPRHHEAEIFRLASAMTSWILRDVSDPF